MKSYLSFVIFVPLAVLSGCGGNRIPGGGRPATGALGLTITWPGRDRLIPLAANSIQVVLQYNGQPVANRVIPRPAGGGSTTTATIDNLRVGALTLTATAHPNADGTGTAQARGSVPVTIQDGQTTPVGLTLGSTIDHLEIAPSAPSVGVSRTVVLTATARDAAGNAVLTWPGKITWESQNTGVATVDAGGKVTGVAVGTASISATEGESGKSATVDVAVVLPGAISFLAPVHYAVPSPIDVRVADLDADGPLDLLVTNGTGDLSLLHGAGDGTFAPREVVPVVGVAGDNPILLNFGLAEDLNGDGRLDLVAADNSNNRLCVLLGQGGRAFGAAAFYAVGTTPYGITAGDFNGDEKPDLAACNGSSRDIAVLLNQGAGTFAPAVFYPIAGSATRVGTADFNGDGKLDLAVSDYSRYVFTYRGNGDGTFVAGPTYTVGNAPSQVIAADLNNDGKVDLATSNYYGYSISVLTGLGDGTFAVSALSLVNMWPNYLVAADLDGDGWLDLAAPNRDSYVSQRTGGFAVLKNTGGGLFAAPVKFSTDGTDARHLAAGDLNGDGRPDLAVTNSSQGRVSVLLNTTP
ncbi:MAG: VCBS repeat-containing protein [Armatimonadetes bacterium]|nr:VCBS repeat-containing protein [Armatimonadota bacterium]